MFLRILTPKQIAHSPVATMSVVEIIGDGDGTSLFSGAPRSAFPLVDLFGFDNWQEVAGSTFQSTRWIGGAQHYSRDQEERLELFEMKKIVLALAEKVLMGQGRELTVSFWLDMRSLLRPVGMSEGQIEMAGTCSRKR
jgi:hypothetical protein